ncbi:MAG: protein kinase domain-containing protein [Thermoanaerobaculia bacterium]
MTPEAGTLLGHYRLLARVGAGGMGEVWKAEDTRLLRPVAVKILSKRIATDEESKVRFLREARTAAQLNHPNIATIYSVDNQDDVMYIAMELVDGHSLAELIAGAKISRSETVRMARLVAQALAEAHSKGIVHRDIKPENIIVTPRTVKVLDFGIAKQVGVAKTMENATLTQGGMILGTPYYMSPEQALGKPVDGRTDLFSLGVVLYEALSSQRPFRGDTITETIVQIVMSDPPDITTVVPSVPYALAEVVRKCLQKKTENRYRDVDELIEALERVERLERSAVAEKNIPTIPTPIVVPDYPAAATQPPSAEAIFGRPSQPLRPQTQPPIALPRPPQPQPPPQTVRPPQAQGLREQPHGPEAPKQSVVDRDGTPSQRALVVDDDAVTRQLLGSLLTQHRLAFDEAANGAEAIKFLKEREYTLMFLDLLMPRIDGWGVLDFLRSRRDKRKKPRLYVITAVRDQKLSEADKELVAGVVYKPIDQSQIDDAVKQALTAA